MTRLQKAIDLINSGAVRESTATSVFQVKSYTVTVTPSSDPNLTTYTCTCPWGSHDQNHLLTYACSHAWAVAGYIDTPVVLPST